MPPSSSTSSRRTYLFPGHPMAAPLDVPVGYHIAIGAPLGLRASASSSPSAPHPDPPRPSCASGQAPCLLPAPPHRFPKRACPTRLRRTTAGMPGHCAIGAGGPPHRQSTSTPGYSAATALHHRPSPTRRRGPASPPPSAARKVAAAGAASGGRQAAAHGRSRGAARVAPPPVELPCRRALPLLFLSVVVHNWERIREGRDI